MGFHSKSKLYGGLPFHCQRVTGQRCARHLLHNGLHDRREANRPSNPNPWPLRGDVDTPSRRTFHAIFSMDSLVEVVSTKCRYIPGVLFSLLEPHLSIIPMTPRSTVLRPQLQRGSPEYQQPAKLQAFPFGNRNNWSRLEDDVSKA